MTVRIIYVLYGTVCRYYLYGPVVSSVLFLFICLVTVFSLAICSLKMFINFKLNVASSCIQAQSNADDGVACVDAPV